MTTEYDLRAGRSPPRSSTSGPVVPRCSCRTRSRRRPRARPPTTAVTTARGRAMRYLEWTWTRTRSIPPSGWMLTVRLPRSATAAVHSYLDSHLCGLFPTATWIAGRRGRRVRGGPLPSIATGDELRVGTLGLRRRLEAVDSDRVRRRTSGGAVGGQRLLEHVPREHRALDAHGVLHDALEGHELAERVLVGLEVAGQHRADLGREPSRPPRPSCRPPTRSSSTPTPG